MAFNECTSLSLVSFPKYTTIASGLFFRLEQLIEANFSKCTTIGSEAFQNCYSLTSISFPECTTIYSKAFAYCSSLTEVSFPKCITIGSSAFYECTSLESIYLLASSVCSLANSNAFSLTGIGSDKGSIFVPASLVSSYQTANQWSFFSDRIFAYE